MIDTITLIIAAIGAVLGIVNTWYNLSQKKLSVRVTPNNMMTTDGIFAFSINVLNLSSFPIIINEIGFTLCDGNKIVLNMYKHEMIGKELPARIEHREAISLVFYDLYKLKKIFIKNAYATTACGEKFTGDSPALKSLKKSLL